MNEARTVILDIFIPYWGDPEYMKQTVNSVLTQTSDRWKLTIVDDAYPTHEIEKWVSGLADDRITFIRKDENEGITANYQTCIGLASEPIMMMLGSDDRLLPNFVDEVLTIHERFPEASIIQPGVEVIDSDGKVVNTLVDRVKRNVVQPSGRGHQIYVGESLAVSLLNGDWLYWPSLVFRTDKIKTMELRNGFPLIQDLALVIDMILRGDSMAVGSEVCFQYRRHSASASSKTLVDGTRFEGEKHYFDLAASLADEVGWTRAARAARLRVTSRAHSLLTLPQALKAKDRSAAKTLFTHTFGR